MLQALRGGARLTTLQIGEEVHLDRLAVRAALDRLRHKGPVRLAGRAARARFWGESGAGALWEALTEAGPVRGA